MVLLIENDNKLPVKLRISRENCLELASEALWLGILDTSSARGSGRRSSLKVSSKAPGESSLHSLSARVVPVGIAVLALARQGGVETGGALGLGGGSLLGLLLLLELFGLPVEEHVNHDIPRADGGNGSPHLQDHPGQQPVEHADGVLSLVVRRDGDINAGEVRVGIAEGDDRDVHVSSLADRLVVGARVGDDDQTGLGESLLRLVGEGTWGVAPDDAVGTGVVGKLQHSALAVRASGDGDDVLGVVDGDDDTGSHLELVPGLGEVEDEDSVVPPAVHVAIHRLRAVLGAKMALGSQKVLDIALLVGDAHVDFD
mmetsp:Transcript_15729/g.44937  ORF Transcript_15729/g.44937 Transcript_15729/m.44937 type:complete len:314 (+) Transcript_15729:366-1307(+)